MRRILAIIIGRILSVLGGFVNRSSNMPGKIALKICPNFLKQMKFKGKIIAVTGSNGKTTTTNLIAHILKENGYKVVCNEAGANLTAGIVTTLLNSCNLSGYIDADFTVLECDERFVRFIFADVTPDYFVITNLLRDQVTRNGNPDLVMKRISEGIKSSVVMVLNANDPISGNIVPQNKRVYYALDKTVRSTEQNESVTHDCKVCPKCFSLLDYSYYHFNHIGKFACSSCDYKTPQTICTSRDIDFDSGDFKVNDIAFHTDYGAAFHYLNIAAACAVCTEIGLETEKCVEPVKSFKLKKDRFDEFPIGDKKGVLILTKLNPVSFDQSIDYALAQKGEKAVVFYINNAFNTDNKDISWIYDVSFEKLKGKVNTVFCCGSRALDVGVRLELGGFEKDSIKIDNSIQNLKPYLKNANSDIYVLAATAFGDDDGILEAIKQ